MKLEDVIEKLENEKRKIRFAYLARVCQENFGNPRIKGSHHIFKTPWKGDPRINLQEVKGYAKPYQVEQVIEALQKLQVMEERKEQAEQGQTKGDTHHVAE